MSEQRRFASTARGRFERPAMDGRARLSKSDSAAPWMAVCEANTGNACARRTLQNRRIDM